jgi:predicted nucleotidyltransferase
MTHNKIPTYIIKIADKIAETLSPEKIILFGSHARGDADADSDLDLLVIIPKIKKMRAESVRVRRALRGLLVPVDIIVSSPEQIKRLGDVNGLIYHTALSEGRILYERS